MQAHKKNWQSLPGGGFVHQGINYHVNDFVYIHCTSGGLLDIGQIIEFTGSKPGQVGEIKVLQYGRYDHVAQQADTLLYQDNVSRLFHIVAYANPILEETIQDKGHNLGGTFYH